MPRKKKEIEISKEVKKEIIDYCNGLLLLLNQNFLRDNNILENEFLEYLYASCENIYKRTNDFRLTSSEIVELIEFKKQVDFNISEVEQGIAIITNIDKDDNLIFDYKKKEK